MDQRDDTLASLGEANDQLMAKNHALAKALNRATQELTKAKAQPVSYTHLTLPTNSLV